MERRGRALTREGIGPPHRHRREPAEEKKVRRAAPTVAESAAKHRAERISKKAESSQKNDWAIIRNEILPILGDRKVAEISRQRYRSPSPGDYGPRRSRAGESRPRGRVRDVRIVAQADCRRIRWRGRNEA